jgi:hypothetical protein
MPNWVFNSLVVSGDKATLDEMVAQLNKPVTKYYRDFVYLPTEDGSRKVKQDENGNAIREVVETHYPNPVFSFMNVVAPTDLDTYYGDEVFKKRDDTFNADGSFNTEAFNKEFVRSINEDNDWWHWNVRNWGTKWDIAVADGVDYALTEMTRNEDGSIHYRFETAWSPVFEVLTKLSKMYPTLEFSYDYEEEQGWGGEAVIANGEIVSESEYDIPSCHADYVTRDRECNCEVEPNYPEYWYEDCPADKTKYEWVDEEWQEIEMSDPSAMMANN